MMDEPGAWVKPCTALAPAGYPLAGQWLEGFLGVFPAPHRAYLAAAIRRAAAAGGPAFFARAEDVVRDMAAVTGLGEAAARDLGAMAARPTLDDLAPTAGPAGHGELVDRFYAAHEYPLSEHGVFIWLDATAARRDFTVARCREVDRAAGGAAATVLEVGFGPGEVLAAVLAACPSWSAAGVDISPACLQYAGRLLERRGVAGRARLIVGDLGRLPFPDRSFDVVIANEVLEHLPDPSAGAAELARVLRAGGTAVVCLPLRMPMRSHMIVFDTAAEAGALLAAAGLTPWRVETVAVLGPMSDAFLACRGGEN